MLNAFHLAAGFSAYELGMLFRVMFATLVTLWTSWVAYRQFFIFTKGHIALGEWGKNMISLIMMWTFLMLLIVV